MTHLKAIIFDVDGTLANTEETHRQAFNIAFREYDLNFEWSKQEYANLLAISGGKERIYAYLKDKNIQPDNGVNLREFTLDIHRRKSEIYREKLIDGHIGLRPGIARLLDEATKNGVRLAIATSTSTSNVETLMRNALGADVMRWFDSVVTSDVVTDKKPSPVVYQFALAELGLKPEDCIAIEDTHNGNMAALEAGLKTIITTHVFTREDNFEGASLILDQLGEPDKHFSVAAGNAHGANYLDIALLGKILADDTTHSEYDSWEPRLAVAIK